VRSAFDADSTLAAFGIQILPEGDHVVLIGNVSDEQAQKSAIAAAKKAAGNVRVESRLQNQSK